MKTLLIYPPCSFLVGDKFIAPLGICALKSFLINNGYKATVWDLNIKTYLDCEHKELWLDNKDRLQWEEEKSFYNKVLPKLNLNRYIDDILSRDDDIIGFSISYFSIFVSLYMAEKIKEHSQKKIIFGGAGCYEKDVERYLSLGIDAIIMGEGEETLLELVRDFKLCKGVYMLQNNQVVYGGARKLLDIDSLPYPDFDDIIDDYRKFSSELRLSSSFLRGCTNRCAFCDESPYWQRVRQRSPENIIKELSFLKSRYNITGFDKGDSTLVDSPVTLNKICDLIINSKLNLKWYSQVRPEKWLTYDLLQKMQKSGFIACCYGVESGSQKVIDGMNKKLNIKEIERVIRDTKKAGISVGITLMVDSPKESLFDFFKTVLFLLKIKKHVNTVTVSVAFTPYRSDWYKNPDKYGIIGNNHWHTKYYLNNHITAKIKKWILELLKTDMIHSFNVARFKLKSFFVYTLKSFLGDILQTPDRLMGKTGILTKKYNPDLYRKIRKIKGDK